MSLLFWKPGLFYLLGASELPRHQGFGPLAQNAWDAALAAGMLAEGYLAAGI